MVKLHLELEGDADEVAQALRRIVGGDFTGGREPAGASAVTLDHGAPEAAVVAEPETAANPADLPPGGWTEKLAADFVAGLNPVARQVVLHVWRAGEAGIHRRQLCQCAGLTPAELRGLLIGMGQRMRRFQRERGLELSRPVVANAPLQSYFIDADFAAAATSRMFGDEA